MGAPFSASTVSEGNDTNSGLGKIAGTLAIWKREQDCVFQTVSTNDVFHGPPISCLLNIAVFYWGDCTIPYVR